MMRKGEVVAVFQSYEPPHQTSVRQHCNVLGSWDAVGTGKISFCFSAVCIYEAFKVTILFQQDF